MWPTGVCTRRENPPDAHRASSKAAVLIRCRAALVASGTVSLNPPAHRDGWDAGDAWAVVGFAWSEVVREADNPGERSGDTGHMNVGDDRSPAGLALPPLLPSQAMVGAQCPGCARKRLRGTGGSGATGNSVSSTA